MNPAYQGDSYDLVKRFFCRELQHLGYTVAVDPMFTGEWCNSELTYYRLISATPLSELSAAARTAILLDPDTGVREKATRSHVSFERIIEEARTHDLVVAFDQSFSRGASPKEAINGKLSSLHALGVHGMYYDSHARFLFAASESARLYELRAHLQGIGLPDFRLVHLVDSNS